MFKKGIVFAIVLASGIQTSFAMQRNDQEGAVAQLKQDAEASQEAE